MDRRTWREPASNDTHAQWQRGVERPGSSVDLKHGAQARKTPQVQALGGWLHPLDMLANLPTYPAQWFVKRLVQRTIKKAEFVPTVRLGLGIVLFPVWWFLQPCQADCTQDGDG